jgi:rRNA biogenesis protein RRP5
MLTPLRFLFKKWLALEGRIGDAGGEDRAKGRAKEWVVSQQAESEAKASS